MVKKLLALAALLLFASAGVASAQAPPNYPPPQVDILVTVSGQQFPGGMIQIHGRSFPSGAQVSFTIAGQTQTLTLGQAQANSSGVVTLSATLPLVQPGNYTITGAVVGNPGVSASQTISIACQPAGCPPGLVSLSSGDATVAGITVDRPAALAGSERSSRLPQILLGAFVLTGLATLATRRRSTKESDAASV